MSNPKFEIVSIPDFKCVAPRAVVTYQSKLTSGKIATGTRFQWYCYNDPATHSERFEIVRGPSARDWKETVWGFPGRHTIQLEVTHPDGSKAIYKHNQWVDEATNILNNEFNPKANDNEPGPFAVLEYKTKEYQITLDIAKAKPPTGKLKEKHEKEIEQLKSYTGHLKHNLKGLHGFWGIAVDALYFNIKSSGRLRLRLWLVNKTLKGKQPTWVLVDWTNPLNRSTTGVYKGSGDTHQEAVEKVISDWNRRNRYPGGGIIKYELKSKTHKVNVTGEFETDGKSSSDEVSTWLDRVALGAGVVALVVTLVAPVPGSRLVSAAIWTSIVASTTSAAINISARNDEGFSNWKDDVFDILTIAGNLFAGAGMYWKVGASFASSAIKLGPNMSKGILIGLLATDGLQGVLLGAIYINQFNYAMNNPNLTPNERLGKILGILRSAALNGLITYISIKGTKWDLNNLNNNRTRYSRADITNPNTLINVDEVIPSSPVRKNQVDVKTVADPDVNSKPLGPEKQRVDIPSLKHAEINDFDNFLKWKVKKRAEDLIKSNDPSKLSNELKGTSQSGIKYKGEPIYGLKSENLGGSNQLKGNKEGIGIKKIDRGNFEISDAEKFMDHIEEAYKKGNKDKNGKSILLQPMIKEAIKKHIDSNGSFRVKHGVPGLHAEVVTVNNLLYELKKQGLLHKIETSDIKVATYRLIADSGKGGKVAATPKQGTEFPACNNCSSILQKLDIDILTGIEQ